MNDQTFVQLTGGANELEQRFEALNGDTHSANFDEFVHAAHQWLKSCIEHGRYLPTGTPERRTLQGHVDYWASRLLHVGHAFDDIDRLASFDAEAGRVLPESAFPYHDLMAVTAESSHRFFGREEEIHEYVEHLEAHSVLLILGDSGSGKSSIAMAGILPELVKRHADDWLAIPRITPGIGPVANLRQALANKLNLPPHEMDTLGAGSLKDVFAGRKPLVYIDQLEELVTMCTDQRQQADFSELIRALVVDCNARLLATIRSDHHQRLAHSAPCHALFKMFAGCSKVLSAMSLQQLREVIEKPAEIAGLRFVPASIIETLASESASTPSGLPLLQFALRRLWDERQRNAKGEALDLITEQTYRKLPTVSEALGAVAEHYYQEIDTLKLQPACKRLMLELTMIDERFEVPLRRRRAEQEVVDVLVGARLADEEKARKLIKGFVDRRLIVRTNEGKASQLEVAHEALFRHWPRFQNWLNSGDGDSDVRATLREIRQLTQDALLWEQGQRSADLVKLRGGPLASAGRLDGERWLDPLTSSYVEASRASARKAKLNKWGTRGVLFGLVIILVVGFFRNQARQEVARQKSEGAANTLAALVRNLKPLDALDLLYTLHDRVDSTTSLAHAIDRLAGGILVGKREQDGAYFTTGGRATVQLVRNAENIVSLARIVPLGANGAPWPRWIEIQLDHPPGEILAALDVGPASAQDARLVVATFIRRSIENPSSSDQVTSPRVVIYQIEKESASVKRLNELSYPAGTRHSSDVAFGKTGQGFAIAAPPLSGARDALVLTWNSGEKGLAPVPISSGNQSASVTAVDYGGVDGMQLIMGRSDGSILCNPTGAATRGADESPIVSLRAAPGTRKYVALHASNSLAIGDCAEGRAQNLTVDARPQNLVLLAANRPDRAILSYVAGGKLMCQHIEGARLGETCWEHSSIADQAIPISDGAGSISGYKALPDSGAPLMMWLPRNASAQGAEARNVAGIPGAIRRAFTDANPVAASPDGRQLVVLGRVGMEGSEFVQKLQGQPDRSFTVRDLESAAVDNQGTVLVLSKSTGSSSNYSLNSFLANGAIGKSISVGQYSSCMGLSPDGRQVVVASERWEARAIPLNGGDLSVSWQISDVNRKGVGVAACAIGDGDKATMVMASRDGQVFRSVDGSFQSISDLVAFRLGSAPLSISIDSQSRFVAVVGERLASSCQSGMSGHPLRIWDLKGMRPDFPVVSTCLSGPVRAIGAVEKSIAGWSLPVTELRDGKYMRFNFPCLSCGTKDEQQARNERLRTIAATFQATSLDDQRIKALYGFSP